MDIMPMKKMEKSYMMKLPLVISQKLIMQSLYMMKRMIDIMS